MKLRAIVSIAAAAAMLAGTGGGVDVSPVSFPVMEASAAEHATSGTCGKNAAWKLDDKGTLTVSGTGDMDAALDRNPCPWKDFKDEIKAVVIGKGITSIGMGMFSDCKNLTSVSFPSTLKAINTYSFTGCEALGSVVIPDGVTNIGSSSFAGCKKLSDVTIPKSVTYIGALAFSGTAWFEAQKSIDDPFIIINGLLVYVYYDLSGDVVIPETVSKICEQAAERRSKITSLTIPETVTEIGYNAFLGCSSLKTVTIPESVHSIGMQAFVNCTALKEVTILDPDAKIYDRATTFTNGNDEYSGVIKGYDGSTAEAYAEKYGYKFVSLGQRPAEYQLGDVDRNGVINAVDASEVLSYYARISTKQEGGFTAIQKKAADTDENGLINAVDASCIL